MDAIEATPHLLGCRVDGVSFTQVDFYDRSVLGEGIHCLKCGSFVNLPRDGDPMVQCCVIINRNDAGLVIFDLYTGPMSLLCISVVRAV